MAKKASHLFVRFDGRVYYTPKMTPADVVAARKAEASSALTCPLCDLPMRLQIEQAGPVAYHTSNDPLTRHEPETPNLRRLKSLTVSRLKELVPSATIDADVVMEDLGLIGDVALVTGKGGRLVVEVHAADISAREVRKFNDAWTEQAVKCLWILDYSRLRLPKSGGIIKKTTLSGLETGLLSIGQPLIYLDGRDKTITKLTPPPEAVELARLGEPRIGQVECLIRRYRLDQLRLKNGAWWVDTRFDSPAPKPREISARLKKKLEQRRLGQ